MADIHTGMEEYIDADDMSLCPLCDNVILEHEEIAFALAHGCKCIVHKICVDAVLGE